MTMPPPVRTKPIDGSQPALGPMTTEIDIWLAAAMLVLHCDSMSKSVEAIIAPRLAEFAEREDEAGQEILRRLSEAVAGLRACNFNRQSSAKNRVLGIVMLGFVAFWRGCAVRSGDGQPHFFPSADDAWMYLGLCDLLNGMPAVAAGVPAPAVFASE